MSRPLLKLGGDSGDILSDVLRLPGVSEAETVISGAEGRDELRHIRMSLQAPEPFGCFEHTRGDPAQHHLAAPPALDVRLTWRVRLMRLSAALVVASERWRRGARPSVSTVTVSSSPSRTLAAAHGRGMSQ